MACTSVQTEVLLMEAYMSVVLLASFFIEMMLLLCWDDREQFPTAYTAVAQVDVFCHLCLCVELNKAGFECF